MKHVHSQAACLSLIQQKLIYIYWESYISGYFKRKESADCGGYSYEKSQRLATRGYPITKRSIDNQPYLTKRITRQNAGIVYYSSNGEIGML